jgi:hypothetical protein
MRTSLRSFPSSSWSQSTATSSHHRHPRPEVPPRHCEPQPLPVELFTAPGEHPHDPLSVLPLSPSCLVHWSSLATMLWRAARPCIGAVGSPVALPLGCAGAITHRPSMDQWPGLDRQDSPSAHLFPNADHQMNDPRLMKSRGRVHRCRGLGPPHDGPMP